MSALFSISQGDSYDLPFKIHVGEDVRAINVCEDIELNIGGVYKSLRNNEISYNSDLDEFVINLTQNDTRRIANNAEVEIRCKFYGADVVGKKLGRIEVEKMKSRAVL